MSYVFLIAFCMGSIFLCYFIVSKSIFATLLPEDFMKRWKEIVERDPELKHDISKRLSRIKEIIDSKKDSQSEKAEASTEEETPS